MVCNKPPPNERPNWHRLNEGQRRYAWEQYNLALVRRGLPINHPIPGREEGNQHADGDIDALLDRPASGEAELAAELGRELEPQQEAVDGPSIEDFDESLFESHPQRPDSQHSGAMADSSVVTPTKPPKRARTEAGPSTAADSAKKLPGTARDQGGIPGEGGPRSFRLPHPRSLVHSHVRFYSKMHKVLTYGIAYKNINVISGIPPITTNYLSTPLCNVPWDWLFWYLNPSEFALLPNQSSVTKCKVSILQRNVRIAFPTNSTANNLATLNQNKDVITAIGLNKKVDAVHVKYTGFDATQPMIPNALARFVNSDYQNLNNELYGTSANVGTVVPRHQVGIPMQLPIYLALIYENPETAPQDGWECLQAYYNDVDADATSGGVLLEHEYHPVCGLCKAPDRQVIRKLRNQTITIPRGSHVLDPQSTTVGIASNQVNETSTVNTNTTRDFSSLNDTYQLIEKSQQFFEGVFQRPVPRVQDSIHIGVQPTIALTTANLVNDQSNNSFTDTQAYFEIHAEIEINTAYPTYRPLTLVSNVKDGCYWEKASTNVNYTNVLFDGLRYTS